MNGSLLDRVQSMVPPGYDYGIAHVRGTLDVFDAQIRLRATSLDEFKVWLAQFRQLCNCDWLSALRKKDHKKQRFVCSLSQACKLSRDKDTRREDVRRNKDCPAYMNVTLRVYKDKTLQDVWSRNGYHCMVSLHWEHSHDTHPGSLPIQALRRPSEVAKRRMIHFFDLALSCAEAQKELVKLLHEEAGENIAAVLLDASQNPSERSTKFIQESWKKRRLGYAKGKNLIEVIVAMCDELRPLGWRVQSDGGARQCVMVQSEQEARTSSLPSPAHNLLYLMHVQPACLGGEGDAPTAAGGGSGAECSVTIALRATLMGALPLALLVTRADAAVPPLHLLHAAQLVDEHTVIVAASPLLLPHAQRTWPGNHVLLCITGQLHQVWKWLWNGKNGIPLDKRATHMSYFTQVAFAATGAEAQQAYERLISNNGLSVQFKQHVHNCWANPHLPPSLWCYALNGPRSHSGLDAVLRTETLVRLFAYVCKTQYKFVHAAGLVDVLTAIGQRHQPHNQPNQGLSLAKEITVHERIVREAIECGKTRIFRPLMVKAEPLIKNAGDNGKRDPAGHFKYSLHRRRAFADLESMCCTCDDSDWGSLCKHVYATAQLHRPALFREHALANDERTMCASAFYGDNIPDDLVEKLRDPDVARVFVDAEQEHAMMECDQVPAAAASPDGGVGSSHAAAAVSERCASVSTACTVPQTGPTASEAMHVALARAKTRVSLSTLSHMADTEAFAADVAVNELLQRHIALLETTLRREGTSAFKRKLVECHRIFRKEKKRKTEVENQAGKG